MTDRDAGETFAECTQLETLTCASRGVLFAMPEHMSEKRRETGEVFYCPSGHSLAFGRTRRKLEQKLAAERRRSGRLAAERDQSEARLRRRFGAGKPLRDRIAVGLRACHRAFCSIGRTVAGQQD